METSLIEEHENIIVKCIHNIPAHNNDENVYEELLASIKFLRNICSRGPQVQYRITSSLSMLNLFLNIVENNFNEQFQHLLPEQKSNIELMVWQLLANLCVNNIETQKIIWDTFGLHIQSSLNEISIFTDIQMMILYNISKNKIPCLAEKDIFQILITVWSKLLEMQNDQITVDFLHIFFEEFLCNSSCRIITIYGPLSPEDRILTLKYISAYIRNASPNGQIHKTLMEYISKEFKKKSDCILRVNDQHLNQIYPQEVLALLDVISLASGDETYARIYCDDQSLFLNVGGLLQTLNEVGKKSDNIFTPMEKLVEVAPNSRIDRNFENEVSYQLRTQLVRTLANLLYRNSRNQDYAREMNIIMAILDSTRVDARNPMIKEWGILAIRNLCENCPQNQEIISQLCKVGDAPNDILTELSLEMGSLRIKPNE